MHHSNVKLYIAQTNIDQITQDDKFFLNYLQSQQLEYNILYNLVPVSYTHLDVYKRQMLRL